MPEVLSGPPIALGFTAEIYPWKDGQVLKLFDSGPSPRTVEHEAWPTRQVLAEALTQNPLNK